MQTGLVFGIIMIIILICIGLFAGYVAARWAWAYWSKVRITTMGAAVVPIMCLLICVPAGAQSLDGCNLHTSLTGFSTTCTFVGTLVNCTLDGYISAAFENIGDKMCYSLADDSSTWLGDITMEYIAHSNRFETILEYFTSNWYPQVFTQKYCAETLIFGSAYCNHGVNDCLNNLQDPGRGEAIMGNSLLFPGESVCMDSCGCAGCDCFSCDSACTYGRFAITPAPSVWKVKSIETTGTSVPVVRVCANSPQTGWFCEEQNVDTIFGIFNGSIPVYVSSWQKTVPSPNNQISVIIGVGDSTLTQEQTAPAGYPVSNQIGDIQATTAEAFTTGLTSDSFIFDPRLCVPILADGGILYDCALSGARIIQAGQTNILSLSNIYVCGLYQGEQVWCQGGFARPFTARIEFGGNVSASRVLTQICPEAEFLSVTGCHSCNTGGYLTIRVRSTCLPGTVILTANGFDLGNSSVALTRNWEVAVLLLQASDRPISGVLTLHGVQSDDFLLSIAGSLTDPIIYLNTPGTQTVGNATSTIDGWNWGQRIGLIVGVTIAAIVVLGIIAAGVTFFVFKGGAATMYERLG
jgi:hypothetical protein